MLTKSAVPNTCGESRRCGVGVTEFCAAVVLALVTCVIDAAQAQNGNLLWAKRAGGSFDDSGNAIAVDSEGNSYVTGQFQGTGTFAPGEANEIQLMSAGSADVFVAKYNQIGGLVWVKKAGGSSFDRGTGIAVDNLGIVYVVGAFVGTATFGLGELNETALTATGAGADIFVAKYNSDGSLAWAKQAGGAAGDVGLGIAIDGQGNSYITGNFFGTATFGAGEPNEIQHTAVGSFDFFIAKYNGNGTLAWAKRAEGTGFDGGRGIAVDGQGSSYVTGTFNLTATFGKGEANESVLASLSASDDIFIAKYNGDGTLAWAKRAGGASSDAGFAIAVDSQGNSYVTGLFAGTATFGLGEAHQTQLVSSSASDDIFIAKYNSDGTLAWAKRAGGISSDLGLGIALDSQANSYVTGQFSGSATFGLGEPNQTTLTSTTVNPDAFVAKFNNSGALAWAKPVNGANQTFGTGIAVDGQGNSHVTGLFNLATTFGGGEANQTILNSGGFSDIFIARFAGGPLLVNCPTDSLQAAINLTVPSQSVIVNGTCNENILARNEKQRVTIDGSGAGVGTRATVNGNTSSPTFNIRGKGILLQNFTIAGGSHGVWVNRGANAVINNTVIQGSAGNGVMVDELAIAVLTNNLIQNHSAGAGVTVNEASTARIGFNADSETMASVNTIQNNAVGIVVSNGASARIVGNAIQNNSSDGIQVLRDSHADIASNTISGNGGDGIEVGENSSLQLGEDSGATIFDLPNSGSGNAGNGVKCTTGSIADGVLGALTGGAGAKNFADTSCVDSLS